MLTISRADLGKHSPISVRFVADDDLSRTMAEDLAGLIKRQNERTEPCRIIVPVGPVGQYPLLAEICNRERISLANTWLFNMDEYLTAADRYIPIDHPLSFRGFMNRAFYDLLDAELAPPNSQRVFPNPQMPEQLEQTIRDVGGIDACYGGVGINGHIAFNEPPPEQEHVSVSDFADLPTRVLSLSCETRTINSVTVGGAISIIPPRAVTIGMREILDSRRVRIYCNRPWQRGILRQILHGPVTPMVPCSLLQNHPDAVFTIAESAAAAVDIGLR